jgi:hypothetical protein
MMTRDEQRVSEIMPVMNKRQKLRHYILIHGCYNRDKNLLFYEKQFANSSLYLFRAVDQFLCERAGFRTVEVPSFYSGFL